MIGLTLFSFAAHAQVADASEASASVAAPGLAAGSASAEGSEEAAVISAVPAGLPEAPQPQPGADARVPLQDQPHPPPSALATPRRFVSDLGHIFVAPIYIRKQDIKWLAPLAGASIAAFATDTHVANDVVSHDPTFNNAAGNVSDGLLGTMIALPMGFYAGGLALKNEHARESGLLGGEAMVDALVVDEFVKVVSFRERPNVDGGRGNFYVGSTGLDSSFISAHAMVAWSSAAVIADEYRSPWVKLGVYAIATGTSVDRVLALEHFPTDVLLGSAGGWLIGHYVFRAHHHWSQQEHAASTHLRSMLQNRIR